MGNSHKNGLKWIFLANVTYNLAWSLDYSGPADLHFDYSAVEVSSGD